VLALRKKTSLTKFIIIFIIAWMVVRLMFVHMYDVQNNQFFSIIRVRTKVISSCWRHHASKNCTGSKLFYPCSYFLLPSTVRFSTVSAVPFSSLDSHCVNISSSTANSAMLLVLPFVDFPYGSKNISNHVN
jgi:hypothetical protein